MLNESKMEEMVDDVEVIESNSEIANVEEAQVVAKQSWFPDFNITFDKIIPAAAKLSAVFNEYKESINRVLDGTFGSTVEYHYDGENQTIVGGVNLKRYGAELHNRIEVKAPTNEIPKALIVEGAKVILESNNAFANVKFTTEATLPKPLVTNSKVKAIENGNTR